jgi:UrcA family protein
MDASANPELLAPWCLKYLGGCLLGLVGTCAAAPGTPATALHSASWQETVQYIVQRFPSCKEYPQSTGAASIRGDRVAVRYADLNYGTTDSFPLRARFTAEAHSSDGSWRLFVHFPNDVVTTDVPSLNAQGRSNVFFCDGDMETTEGLAAALTRLHDLLVGGSADGQSDSGLPEVTVRDHRELIFMHGHHLEARREGGLVTLSERLNVADLDLSTPTGAHQLRARINDSARAVCQQFELLSPTSDSSYASCVRDAVAEATKHTDELVVAARKR